MARKASKDIVWLVLSFLVIGSIYAYGGSISGKVTDILGYPTTYAGYVSAYDATTGYWVGMGYPDYYGNYQITGLPTGNYKVNFGGSWPLVSKYYNNKPDSSTADIVSVTDPNNTPNINASLDAGFYTLDGYGGIHKGGAATPISTTAYWGWNIGRAMSRYGSGVYASGVYVLDGYGGVHAQGGAPIITPATPYFGWDIARDIVVFSGGYYVLDGYGGVHRGGKAPPFSSSPYFGWDIAKKIVLY